MPTQRGVGTVAMTTKAEQPAECGGRQSDTMLATADCRPGPSERPENRMASAEQIQALLASFAERDEDRFRTVALDIAAAAAKAGDRDLARTVKALVDRSRRTMLPSTGPRAVPITRPEGELSTLLTVSYPKVRLADMVLTEEIKSRLERVLTENRAADRLRSHGLEPRRRLLLAGPPGCGKTMTAKALAGETGLPLLVVQFHSLITKYMGETGAKLHAIFESMQRTRGVYLFDEFDVVGTSRGAGDDVGEARRVVNSFLQLLEHDESESIVIAATNRVEALDPALFRRFDDIVQFGPPDETAVKHLVENRLAAFSPLHFRWTDVRAAARGLSHAEVVKACEDAAKEVVMGHRSSVTTAELAKALKSRKRPSSTRARNR
jgi:SpoVK/Ycf46/Vps4 family AAA+-type ATPase